MAKSIPSISRYYSIKNLKRFVSNPINVLKEYIEKKGDTFSIHISLNQKAIVSCNPDFIQHVLQKRHRNYHKSPIQTKTLSRYLGRNLLTSDGPYWLKQRRLIQPGFHRDRLTALVNIMLKEVDTFLDHLDKKVDTQNEIEIVHEMMEVAFRVVAKSLFSTSLKEKDLNHLSANVTELQEFIIKQVRMPFLNPWFKISGQIKKMDQRTNESNKIVLGYISERRNNKSDQNDLLNMLLEARYEDTGEGMTDEQLLGETLILFVAGHETSANALSWAWYLLSQNEKVVAKIREELSTVLGDRDPIFSDFPKLTYLTQVIQETMRLYPPAWITDRISIEEDEINGFPIPSNVMMAPFIYGVHHHPDFWPNPEKFDPSRFEKDKVKQRHSYAYLPFGGGPRLCIGNNFAMMEMQLIIARMLQRYDFELVKNHPIDLQPLVTLRARHGIKLKIRKIKK